MSLAHALHVLNAAAYDAAKAARAECRWALADELRKLALRTDELVDGHTLEAAPTREVESREDYNLRVHGLREEDLP